MAKLPDLPGDIVADELHGTLGVTTNQLQCLIQIASQQGIYELHTVGDGAFLAEVSALDERIIEIIHHGVGLGVGLLDEVIFAEADELDGELALQLLIAAVVVQLDGGEHLLPDLLEGLTVLFGEDGDGVMDGVLLKEGADLLHVLQFLGGGDLDIGAAVGDIDNQTIADELLDGLPDGGAADIEALGNALLHQLFAGFQFAIDDLLLENLINLIFDGNDTDNLVMFHDCTPCFLINSVILFSLL